MRDVISTICAVLCFFLLAGIGFGALDRVNKSQAAWDKVAKGATEPDHTLLLLAETPDGTRVYRVDGPKAVVPVVFVVSKQGSVAVR